MTVKEEKPYWRGRIRAVVLLIKGVFTQARKHYILSLSPAIAIWKDGRISIEITSLGEIARSKSHVWTNPKISCFEKKEIHSFRIKSSWPELFSTRRSTVLILPLQWGFPGKVLTSNIGQSDDRWHARLIHAGDSKCEVGHWTVLLHSGRLLPLTGL